MSYDFYFSWQNQSQLQTIDLDNYQGTYFTLKNGKKLLDLSSTSYHTSFGGNPKSIISHIIDCYQKDATACPKSVTDLKIQATKSLLNFIKKPYGKIFYTLSGSDSIENALKMARQIKQCKTVIARSKSYHGSTLGAISVSGDWRNQQTQTPADWVIRIPEPDQDPDFQEAQNIITQFGANKIAAIVIEVISGANGVIIPSSTWINNLQKFCKNNKIFIIVDEVCTGFFRTGKNFAFSHYAHFEPDFICMGKNISAGLFPFGAIWTSREVADYYDKNRLICGSTNYAHPIGLATLEKVVEILSDQTFKASLKSLEKTFANSLKQLKEQCDSITEIRQQGLIAAIETNKALVWQDFIQAGVYLGVHGNYLTLAPPFVISSKDLISGIKTIQNTIEKSKPCK